EDARPEADDEAVAHSIRQLSTRASVLLKARAARDAAEGGEQLGGREHPSSMVCHTRRPGVDPGDADGSLGYTGCGGRTACSIRRSGTQMDAETAVLGIHLFFRHAGGTGRREERMPGLG